MPGRNHKQSQNSNRNERDRYQNYHYSYQHQRFADDPQYDDWKRAQEGHPGAQPPTEHNYGNEGYGNQQAGTQGYRHEKFPSSRYSDAEEGRYPYNYPFKQRGKEFTPSSREGAYGYQKQGGENYLDPDLDNDSSEFDSRNLQNGSSRGNHGFSSEFRKSDVSHGNWGGNRARSRQVNARGNSLTGEDIYPTIGHPTNQNVGEQLNATIDHTGKGPKGYRRSDERIHEEACDLLAQDSRIDASDIEVTVNNGVITLSGTVDNRYTKRLAEDCVGNIRGALDVKNDIRVGSSQGGGSSQGNDADKSSGSKNLM